MVFPSKYGVSCRCSQRTNPMIRIFQFRCFGQMVLTLDCQDWPTNLYPSAGGCWMSNYVLLHFWRHKKAGSISVTKSWSTPCTWIHVPEMLHVSDTCIYMPTLTCQFTLQMLKSTIEEHAFFGEISEATNRKTSMWPIRQVDQIPWLSSPWRPPEPWLVRNFLRSHRGGRGKGGIQGIPGIQQRWRSAFPKRMSWHKVWLRWRHIWKVRGLRYFFGHFFWGKWYGNGMKWKIVPQNHKVYISGINYRLMALGRF